MPRIPSRKSAKGNKADDSVLRHPEISRPAGSNPAAKDVATVQRTAGNSALGNFLRRTMLSDRAQAELRIGSPHDAREQDAEKAAAQVDNQAAPRSTESSKSPIGSINTAHSSEGQPLEETVRRNFESRLGSELGSVRVHTDEVAQQAAESLGARAFTIGNHIAVAKAGLDAQSLPGRQTLAHELTHVVQQSQGSVTNTIQCAPDEKKPSPNQPKDASQDVDRLPVGLYVDAYDEARYDIDYKSVKGGLSKWIQVSYSFGGAAKIDINIDSIGDETESAAQMAQDMFDHVGEGGRIFPKKMNRSTTPQLWEAKRHVLQIMDDYNALFILGSAFPTVWMILTMGISPSGGGRGGGTVRRPLPRGRTTGSGSGGQEPPAPGGRGAGKEEPPPSSGKGGGKGEAPPESTAAERPAKVGGLTPPGPVPKYPNGEAVWGQGPEGVKQALRNLDKNGLPTTGGSRQNLEGWKQFYEQAQATGKGGETAPLRAELMRRMLEILDRAPK